MQIREKGNKILLIRSHYEPDKKRSFPKTFASFDSYKDEIPAEIMPLLEGDEQAQLEQWISDKNTKRKGEMDYLALKTIASSANCAASCLEGGIGNVPSKQQAKAIYEAIDRLQKGLRKHGLSRKSVAED